MSTCADRLPAYRTVLAVCAHPDDESFGLGGIIAAFRRQGTVVDLLCFTRGESSTLGDAASADELAARRATELAGAGAVLGIRDVRRLAHPDGALASVELDPLVAEVERSAGRGAECLLVFDRDGITGHPDHRRATEAALAAAERADLPVLAWTIEESIASVLNAELGTSFGGRPAAEIDLRVRAGRATQWAAVHRHLSQSTGNQVLHRRLELQGGRDALVWLRRPTTDR